MNNCEQQLDDFYNAISEGLKDKLGCALFQFPPKFSYSEKRIALILQGLKPGYNNVVEFRNESWFENDILETLGRHNITVSGLSHPQLPTHLHAIKNTNNLYYRFHGIPKLFYSAYTEDELKQTAKEIMDIGAVEAWIYFNNTASMAALENARFLQQYLLGC